MYLIDTIAAANGETKLRKRRACRKCHRVNVMFRMYSRVCEDCRDDPPSRSEAFYLYAMARRAEYNADQAIERQRCTG
jgi:hypothetical protein